MNQTPLTLYKLIVLYMLNRVTFPLTRAQISDFILEHDYTNFLTLQQVLSDLSDAAFVREDIIGNRTLLTLTEEGLQTLNYFENRISPQIKEEVDSYLEQNRLQLKAEVSVQSQYYKTTMNEFAADLIAKDNNNVLVSLSLTVPTEEIAASICANWQKKNQEIYKYLTEQLF